MLSRRNSIRGRGSVVDCARTSEVVGGVCLVFLLISFCVLMRFSSLIGVVCTTGGKCGQGDIGVGIVC